MKNNHLWWIITSRTAHVLKENLKLSLWPVATFIRKAMLNALFPCSVFETETAAEDKSFVSSILASSSPSRLNLYWFQLHFYNGGFPSSYTSKASWRNCAVDLQWSCSMLVRSMDIPLPNLLQFQLGGARCVMQRKTFVVGAVGRRVMSSIQCLRWRPKWLSSYGLKAQTASSSSRSQFSGLSSNAVAATAATSKLVFLAL